MLPLAPRTVLLIGAGYCLIAVALDWVSDIGLYSGIGVTPWSPVSGLALAYIYIVGRPALAFIALGEALILLFSTKATFSLPWAAYLVVSNTAVWWLAASALRHLPDFEPRLGSVHALLMLLAVALCQAFIHSMNYGSVLWFSGLINQDMLYPVAWRLVVGHLVGTLVVAPVPLMLYGGWRVPKVTPLRIAQVAVLLVAAWIVFSYRAATAYQLFYLLFLPLLWSALRDGIGGAAIMLNIAQIAIIAGAQMRTDIVPSTGSLQILMIALALTGLLVGSVVTDRQNAGQRLRDQQAALARALRLRSAGETAAAISHQINQPITAISTYALVAKDALEKNNFDLARATLSKLTAECERAATVARSIRDLVKQGSLSSEPTSLQEVLEVFRKSKSAECASLDIELHLDVPGTVPTIQADKVQLEQAVDNLVTNSIESIRDARRGSKIKITAGRDKSDTYIEVEDDGPGFAPGLEALATTPFMTTKPNGSGLGLAIARSVAEAHGGSLAIFHRSNGACVRLRLPITGKQDG